MISILKLEKTDPLYKYCEKAFRNINNKPCHKSDKEFLILKEEKYNGVIYLEDTKTQLANLAKIMNDNGFDVIDKDFDDLNTNVEIHYSCCKDEKVEYMFDIHEDDYGGIDCLLHTCIIYFDADCNGGEFAFYDGLIDRNITQKIDVNCSSDSVTMIIFKGDRYHNALPYTKGHRHLVSPDKKKGLKMKNIFLYIYSKMIRVGRRIYKNGKYVDPVFEDYTNIVVMTASTKYGELSPYSLKNEDGVILENLWQFSKVYKNVPKSIQKYSRYDNTIIWSHDAEIHVDEKGDLTDQYWTWRDKGMKCVYPVRYPVNYNNRHLCLYCLFEDKDCYRELDYIEARKLLYVPEYIKSVKKEKKYRELLERLNKGENLLIIEVDGPHQESLDYYMKSYNVDKDFIVDDTILATDKNLDILLNDPKHPFGHGYCLALALLQNKN